MESTTSNAEVHTGPNLKCHPSPIDVAVIAEKKFSIIEAYDLSPVIERYAKDFHLDRFVAAEHFFIELKKFLSICAASDQPIGMAGPVDDAWHTFLMFTQEYQAFGTQIGKFIHHAPDVDDEDQEASSTGYTSFLQIYELAFKECPPLQYGLTAVQGMVFLPVRPVQVAVHKVAAVVVQAAVTANPARAIDVSLNPVE